LKLKAVRGVSRRPAWCLSGSAARPSLVVCHYATAEHNSLAKLRPPKGWATAIKLVPAQMLNSTTADHHPAQMPFVRGCAMAARKDASPAFTSFTLIRSAAETHQQMHKCGGCTALFIQRKQFVRIPQPPSLCNGSMGISLVCT
jgi:hypothetical protein